LQTVNPFLIPPDSLSPWLKLFLKNIKRRTSPFHRSRGSFPFSDGQLRSCLPYSPNPNEGRNR
jgi:hypothetical protein